MCPPSTWDTLAAEASRRLAGPMRITNNLYLGYNSGASGTYNLSSGSLNAPTETIAFSGSGSFTHTGGTHSVNDLHVGSNGVYNFSGGSLNVSDNVSVTGSGIFTQTGGSQSLRVNLNIGRGIGSLFYLTGGSLFVDNEEDLGISGIGNGSFTQSGGTNFANTMKVGDFPGTNASYGLSGGSLVLSVAVLGSGGTGSFTQSGGTATISFLIIGAGGQTSGTYSLNGGLLLLSGIQQESGIAAFNFGGGTLGACSSWPSALGITLTGSGGNATIDTTYGNIGLAGPLSGAGGLNKAGTGTLTLSASNSYMGTTNVNAGTLAISGSGSLGSVAISTRQTSASAVVRSSITTARPRKLSAALSAAAERCPWAVS